MDPKPLPVVPINIKTPLAYSSRGAFATNDTTIDAVADDLKNLIKTNWGERIIHYDFGANLRSLLFTPSNDVQQQVADAISSAVEKWMPYVSIQNIKVSLFESNPLIDYNRAEVTISFVVGKTGLFGEVNINI